jgi:hypothetical protein
VNQKKYPILEFDPTKRAVLAPSEVFKAIDISEYCVVCFFKDIAENVARISAAKVVFEDKCSGSTSRPA